MSSQPPTDLSLKSIPDAIVEVEGLPQPRWDVIGQWMEANVPPEKADEVWSEFELQWLEGLADTMGSEYSIYRLGRTLLLSPQSEGEAGDLVRFADRAWRNINDFLLNLVPDDEESSVVLVVFEESEKYHSYLSHFAEDEHHAGVVGSVIWGGHEHVALVNQLMPEDLEAVAALELAHLYIRPLDLPIWLNEGTALLAGNMVIDSARFRPGADMPADELERWHKRGLEGFWSGRSFDAADEEQADSFRLAELLVRLVLWDHKKKKFVRYLQEVDNEDAGESAARELFGRGLGELVSEILGPGEWSPPHNG
ncbi:MAG: hypothetical protein JSV91_13290 [Phycisphaerales bacterium]|nr:MAG: hypothetical protein JSV91_13290 [Phycisphaerales bacterium]